MHVKSCTIYNVRLKRGFLLGEVTGVGGTEESSKVSVVGESKQGRCKATPGQGKTEKKKKGGTRGQNQTGKTGDPEKKKKACPLPQ